MSINVTIGATYRRLHELGYAVTFSDSESGIVTPLWRPGARAYLSSMSEKVAGVYTYPTEENRHEKDRVEDLEKRRLVLLILTAYLQADPKQLKSVSAVLERYKLISGPYRMDGFGNRIHVLQYNAPDMLGERGARLAFPDDDATLIFKGAIKNTNFQMRSVGENMVQQPVALDIDRSHVLPMDGEWPRGHLLDMPRRNLPELFENDVREIIADVECARWGARPAASAKEAA